MHPTETIRGVTNGWTRDLERAAALIAANQSAAMEIQRILDLAGEAIPGEISAMLRTLAGEIIGRRLR